jgi:hypothetical protein
MIGYTDPKTKLIHSIYCHWDGYLSNNGRILMTYYKDLKKIKRLVALGSLSSLEQHVSWRTAPKPFVNRHWRQGCDGISSHNKFVEKHTMETPVKDVTVAHWRDRGPCGGEKWEGCKPNVGTTFQGGEEYDYWYHDGTWFYRCDATNHSWVKLCLSAKEMSA